MTASNNTHAGDLTVSGSFAWTGGGIQYGPRAPTYSGEIVPGIFNLAATATGTAAPTDAGTVYLGSHVRLLGDEETETGSTLTVTDGTFELDGGDFQAMVASQLLMNPIPKFSPPSTPGTPSIFMDNKRWEFPTVTVDAGATAKVTSEGRENNTVVVDVKIDGGGVQVLTQGLVVIEEYTRLILAKQPGQTFAQYRQKKAVGSDPPITKLQAGCEIKFEDNGEANKGCVNLLDGELLVYGVPGLTQAAQPVASIVAPANATVPALFVWENANVVFHPFDHFLKLAITGDFTCEGEMDLRADRSTSTNDMITATGFMKYQTGQGPTLRVAKLYVTWRIASGGLPAADTTWTLLAIVGPNGGIVNQPTATIPTDVETPDTLTVGMLPAPKKYGMTFDKQ